MRFHSIPGIALALATLASAASAQTVSFSDPTLSGWTSATIVDPLSCSSGGSTAMASGGNPGAYLSILDNTCGYVANGHLSTLSWNPSTQGAITGFAVSYDITGTTGDVAFGTLLRQGGLYFWSPGVNDQLIAHSNSWVNLSNSSEPLSGWCQVYAAFASTFTCGGADVDFSATGSQIDFGVYSANSGGFYSVTGGIDNFDVDLTHDPAPVSGTPEPATFGLMAIGLAAVFATARRNKQLSAGGR